MGVTAAWHLPSAHPRRTASSGHFCCKSCLSYTGALHFGDITFRTFPALEFLPKQAVHTTKWGTASHGNLRYRLRRLKEAREQTLPVIRRGNPNSSLTAPRRWCSLHCQLPSTISLYASTKRDHFYCSCFSFECCSVAACAETLIPNTGTVTLQLLSQESLQVADMYHSLTTHSSSKPKTPSTSKLRYEVMPGSLRSVSDTGKMSSTNDSSASGLAVLLHATLTTQRWWQPN